ncbi:MAG TPA: hypothetical protein VOA87_08655, partial [Thermoanaerobaculia bacterium]|nr:hypothetical protein [Thermoanaerobaculia bacterium]
GKVLLPLDDLRGQVPFRELAPTVPHGNPLQGDLLELVAPSLAAVRSDFAAGRWPLWNARVGAGMPLLADPQAQALQPLVLLAYPLPYARAAGVTAALRVLLALVFGYLLLRSQGLSAGPSLTGALAFGLGGFLLLWAGWPLANSAALLPLLLYALVRCDIRCADGAGRRGALLLAIATFALATGGHPETFVYALALGLAFLLDRARRRPAGRRLGLLSGAGFAMAIGLLAAAPALLPAAAYLPQSLRAVRLADPVAVPSPPAGVSTGDLLALRLLPIAAPNAYGNSRFLHYWGLANTNEDASAFAGTATLLLALLALGARRRFPQERLMLLVAGGTLVLLARPAGLDGLLAALPLGRALATPRLHLLLGFSLAYLAACTLERFRLGEGRRPAVAAAAVLLAALLVWGYLSHPSPGDPTRLAVLRFGWLRWQLRFLAATALLLIVPWKRLWPPAAKAALAAMPALVAVELLLAHLPANPPSPRRLAFPVNPAIRFLQDNIGDDRMAALGRAFPPNLPSLYGLADARVYNPMAPAAYAAALAPITSAWGGEVPELGSPAHPLYRFLGVRYLMAAPGESCPPPLTLAFHDSTAAICERHDPLPRLFFLPFTSSGKGVEVDSSEGGWIAARLPTSRTALLASSLYQDGGWRLLLDRRPAPSHRAFGPFLAAALPDGGGRIDLLYRPAGLLAGGLLAALGLALGLARGCPPPRKGLE